MWETKGEEALLWIMDLYIGKKKQQFEVKNILMGFVS